jgi:hypothetical protein
MDQEELKNKNKMLSEQLEKIFNKIDMEWKEYQSTRYRDSRLSGYYSEGESEKRGIQ